MFLTRHSFRAARVANLGVSLGFSLRLGLAAGGFFAGLPAQAQDQIGLLECNVAPGVGYGITSSRTLACRFRPTQGRAEYYVGTISRLGLDLGTTGPGRLVWGVLAPSIDGHYALAGHYVGATAEISFGPGVGGNALISDSGNTITLQPLSVNTQNGVDLAAGVADLTLDPAPYRP
jgi:hypothetical protein